ncbi:MBL fold metallo-hydrolase [Mesorhizobium microcysteis]|uniref:MBL fold metallo-hydrolase n=1 Tax=Neoaquamicrobium microcysteis TaxID=2682781 RepID=A0A5D4GVW7_9HYPH|nr:MBL fold metallo-hydrolase [Mesorhizobium microcysteis]TYR32053.1 MBL fold metallo-hydrolase [Mesorhizobium microcysteis]
MAGWFETRPISPGVTLITEPFVHPIFRANLYRIEGRDFDIQLDFGMGIRSLSADLDFGDKPVMAIASHAHIDHVGSFHEFARRAGHHAEERDFATLGDNFTDWFKSLDGAVSRQPYEGWELQDYRLAPAPLTQFLEDGDVVDLGDRRFTVLHLPGHSPGCIALLDEANGEFFSADAIYDDELYDQLEDSSIADYLATMRRLLELDISIGHGGHGPSFDEARMREIALDYIRTREG